MFYDIAAVVPLRLAGVSLFIVVPVGGGTVSARHITRHRP